MKILKNKLKTPLNIRTEMNFPVEGIEFIDINPLLLMIFMQRGIQQEQFENK